MFYITNDKDLVNKLTQVGHRPLRESSGLFIFDEKVVTVFSGTTDGITFSNDELKKIIPTAKLCI